MRELRCVRARREPLAYTDTLGLSTRGKARLGKKEPVRLPKTHYNNPNDNK